MEHSLVALMGDWGVTIAHLIMVGYWAHSPMDACKRSFSKGKKKNIAEVDWEITICKLAMVLNFGKRRTVNRKTTFMDARNYCVIYWWHARNCIHYRLEETKDNSIQGHIDIARRKPSEIKFWVALLWILRLKKCTNWVVIWTNCCWKLKSKLVRV